MVILKYRLFVQHILMKLTYQIGTKIQVLVPFEGTRRYYATTTCTAVRGVRWSYPNGSRKQDTDLPWFFKSFLTKFANFQVLQLCTPWYMYHVPTWHEARIQKFLMMWHRWVTQVICTIIRNSLYICVLCTEYKHKPARFLITLALRNNFRRIFRQNI